MGLDADGTGTEGTTRRRMLGRAGAMVVAGAVVPLTETGTAAAAVRGDDSLRNFLNFTVTQEKFGVTAVTAAIHKVPHGSAQFLPVLRAAVTTEYRHVQALKAIGAKPLTSKFWIPDAVFDSGLQLFKAFTAVETIEVSLYLVGINAFSRRSNAFHLRLCAEALGTEAEHRTLARFAASQLGARGLAPPNNLGFEAFHYKTTAQVQKALTGLGIGYGTKGATPGAFYEYPGNPLANGVGTPVDSPNPT